MYYYKQIDEQGNITAVMTCDTHLDSNEFQIEITVDEYLELLDQMGAE